MNITKIQQLTNTISNLQRKRESLKTYILDLQQNESSSESPVLIYETSCYGHDISVDDYLCAVGSLRYWLKNPDREDYELFYPRERIKTEDDALDCQLKITKKTEFIDSWSEFEDDVTYFEFYCYVELSEEDIQKELTSYKEELKLIKSKIKEVEDELKNLFK